jgi:hypothetical protein
LSGIGGTMTEDETLQRILVRIPAKNLKNRKWITTREALLRKLFELAKDGHPPSVQMLMSFYQRLEYLNQ